VHADELTLELGLDAPAGDEVNARRLRAAE
jgi:hypothetical protein